MLVTIMTYLLPVIQIGIPIYLCYKIWKTNFKIKASWLLWFAHALLAMIAMFVILRWDLVGYQLRYWLYGGLSIALIASSYKVLGVPFYIKGELRWSWGKIFELVIFSAAIIWACGGFNPSRKTVDMQYPLDGNSYNVVQGGSTPIINYHGAFAKPQKYAIDINKLNSWGFRAEGFQPTQPEKYNVFGDTVYCPISGIVVEATDQLKDQDPPKRRPAKPAGNHIWIRHDSLYVLLAHLHQGSIQVQAGEKVQAHQPLAQVGNTGNTTEPHLHIHAVTFPKSKPDPDSLIYGGNPIPITFKGRFLIRNSTF